MRPEGFWSAVGFLTRLPIPATPYNEDTVRRSMVWYPLVGLIIGVLVAGASTLLQWVFPQAPLVVGVMTVACWVAVAGGLHLDGLADTLDAWVGGLGDRERSLAIMKDPHVGSSAVVWLCLFLLAKCAALTSIAATGQLSFALILACSWSRLTSPWLFQLTPYVRAQGLGTGMQSAVSLRGCLALTAIVIIVSLLCLPGSRILWIAPVMAGLFVLGRTWMLQRLGGTTGDTAGALIELSEMDFLLIFLATA